MNPLYSLYYENWRLTVLTVLLVVVSGIAALNNLPKQEDPTISERFGVVTIFLPGAAAERVESLIAEPVENRLSQLREIDRLESTSLPGAVIIDIVLRDSVDGSQTDTVWAKISDQLRRLQRQLPAGSSAPDLDVRTVQADAFMVALTWRGEGSPKHRLLQRLAEDLSLRLLAVEGTRGTTLYGASQERLLLEVDPAELVAAGLTVQDLAAALRARDGRRPSGQVQSSLSRISLELHDGLGTPEQIRNLPVQVPGGASIRLGDVAEVYKSLGNPPDTQVLVTGDDAIVVAAKSQMDQRVDAWVERLQDELREFKGEMSEQVGVQVIYDQSTYTVARLNGLMFNLLLAAAIVFLVLVFFQGLRPAVVIALALPLTCLGTLALMGPFDVGLQQMSVTGLIISLGLLIDNPIVVVDHYQRLRREGQTSVDAIRSSIGHLRAPLMASTLTTIFAFMPIVAGEGGTSEFVGSIALVVVLAVALSLFLALTVIPALNALWEQSGLGKELLNRWSQGFRSERLSALYAASLDVVIRRPVLGILVGLALPLAGFLFFPTLQRNFFPPVDRDMFQVSLSVWTAGAIEETRDQVRKVRATIAQTPGVGRDVWFIGGSSGRPFYNVNTTDVGLKGTANGFIYTASPRATKAILPDLQHRLRQEFPGIRVMVSPYSQGPPISAPLEVRLVGQDLDLVRSVGEQLRSVMLELRQTTYTQSGLSTPYPRYVLYPRQEELLVAGISEQALTSFMAAATDGLHAGNMMDSGRQLPIVIRFPEDLRGDWQRLQGASLLRAGDGSLLPLEAVAEHRYEPGRRNIKHRHGLRHDEVRGWLMPFQLAADSLVEFERALAERDFTLPAGVVMETGGESETSGDSIANLLQTASFFAILMMFSVVLSFSSFVDAAIVATTALLSIGLALFGLRVSDQVFGFTAVIGTLGLVGLSINGTIIVLSALKRSEAACLGDPAAIRQAIMESTRHILATTVTTVLGLSPLMFGDQTFWHPLVWTIAGGVSGSALIALYMMPALFSLRTRKLARQRAEAVAQPVLSGGSGV